MPTQAVPVTAAAREGSEAVLPPPGMKAPRLLTRGLLGFSGIVDVIVSRVKEARPYEVPGVSARPIVTGNPDYLNWVANETNSPQNVSSRPDKS
jgi:hypothetical protein